MLQVYFKFLFGQPDFPDSLLDDLYEDQVDENKRRLFPRNPDKARLGVYLASRQETDFRTGIAVERGYIPWNSPAFKEVCDFLQRLIQP